MDRITVRLRDRWVFNGLSWRIQKGEHWAVMGDNGAGKTTLVKAMAGRLPVVQGRVVRHGLDGPFDISYVSSDERRELWKKEQELSHARYFSGDVFAVTRVRDALRERFPLVVADGGRVDGQEKLAEVIRWCGMESLLDRPVPALSAGEMCRVQIARELSRQPRLLILDEPFDGLDFKSRKALTALLERLTKAGISLVLVSHRTEELPSSITHLLVLGQERVIWRGPINAAPPLPFSSRKTSSATFSHQKKSAPRSHFPPSAASPASLIDMHAVSVRYDGKSVLDQITWSVQENQHWVITGPNGAGKSTLLKLITGECPQVYANAIRLFGKARGPSFSLEEIRGLIGAVNAGQVMGYQKPVSGAEVVLSGFFDSVGVYRLPDEQDLRTVRNWLRRLNLSELSETRFNHLSQGQRQMLLIARAMVKSPKMLILDEPMAGLDAANRLRVINLLDDIAGQENTTILLVSHHMDDIPRCITHHLALEQGRVVYQGPVDDIRSSV